MKINKTTKTEKIKGESKQDIIGIIKQINLKGGRFKYL